MRKVIKLLPIRSRSSRANGERTPSAIATLSGLLLSSEHSAIFRSASATILGANGALYLTGTIAWPKGARQIAPTKVRFGLFDGFWRRTAVHAGGPVTEYEQVSIILRSLLAAVAQAWPPDWVPDHLGIMTDGSGIVFCPELPSPEAEHWTERLVSQDVSTVELLPFAAGSSWSILNAAGSNSRH